MASFLMFSLHGPFAAWGGIAVGERRASDNRPTKSAVLGLLAAALGLDRSDADAHAALDAGYGFAVRVNATGQPLRDYHTAQMPPARRGRTFATRREELAVADLHTVLSTRDYYTDAFCTCALWPRPAAPHALEALQEALTRPTYVLYLGRRACPPALPLRPELIEAESVVGALARRAEHDEATLAGIDGSGAYVRLHGAGAGRLYFDLDAPGIDTGAANLITRRDTIANRPRWQFAERGEGWLDVPGPPGDGTL